MSSNQWLSQVMLFTRLAQYPPLKIIKYHHEEPIVLLSSCKDNIDGKKHRPLVAYRDKAEAKIFDR